VFTKLRRFGPLVAALLGLPSDLFFILTSLGLGGVVTVVGGYFLSFYQQLPTPLFWLLVASNFILAFVGLNHARLRYRKWRSSRQEETPTGHSSSYKGVTLLKADGMHFINSEISRNRMYGPGRFSDLKDTTFTDSRMKDNLHDVTGETLKPDKDDNEEPDKDWSIR